MTRIVIIIALSLAALTAAARGTGLATGGEAPLAHATADSVTIDTLDIALRLNSDSIAQAVQDITDSMMHRSPGIERKRFVPDSHRALWLGLVFPGGGQIYNRKYWKLPIFYGGFLGCLYALNWNNQMYKDYRQAYLDIMDNDPSTASYEEMLPLGYDITGKEERFKSIFKRKKDYYRKYRDMSMFCMIGVWALAVIDGYVDAELSTFDISPELSLQVSPGMFGSQDMARNRSVINTGVRIGLTF